MFQGQTSTKDFRVNKLLKDSSYKFRVCAVNSEGQGPWEEGAATIQAKDPYGRRSQLWHIIKLVMITLCLQPIFPGSRILGNLVQ